MSSIEHARLIRAARAEILANLRDGTRSLRETLRRPPACLNRCTVYEVIVAAHNMGPTGTAKVLEICGVSPITKVAECPDYVRNRIINQLPDRAK